jgi:hypothetical protein
MHTLPRVTPRNEQHMPTNKSKVTRKQSIKQLTAAIPNGDTYPHQVIVCVGFEYKEDGANRIANGGRLIDNVEVKPAKPFTIEVPFLYNVFLVIKNGKPHYQFSDILTGVISVPA